VVPHISTGDMFRAAVKSGTDFGKKAAEYMDRGELIPDEVVIGLVAERLSSTDTHRGFVLDGFPRTVHQAEELSKILAPEDGAEPGPRDGYVVVDLQVPTEVVLQRLAGRRVCSDCGENYSIAVPPRLDWICDVCGGEVVQREDDTEVAIRRRLALYEEQTAPLISWYLDRGLLVTVDGLADPDTVSARLIRAIDDRRRPEALWK
jgi:adenylate kinase